MDEHLQQIVIAAQALGLPVYYGTAAMLSRSAKWDYLVVTRTKAHAGTGNAGRIQQYEVGVVREVCIPEGTLDALYDALATVPGLRPDLGRDVEFDYTVKPGTNITVELMRVPFSRPRKRA